MSFLNRLHRRFRPRKTVTVGTEAELGPLAHLADKPALRLQVPTHLLRMQGGFVYGPDHPFVTALTDGRKALEDFYTRVRPATIAEFYGIDSNAPGHDLPPWEVPWYWRHHRSPPPGERNLGAEHGVAFYGPVTQQKIDLEMARLDGLRDSIGKHGFDPDGHGDIEGYVIRDGARLAFFVRGGKHRAAALAATGAEAIPVAFRAGFPRLVDTEQAPLWPLVFDSAIDAALAQDILRVHVEGRGIPS